MSVDKRNKYRDVLITAKRARQLQGGASPQVTSKSMKFSRVAQEELAAGKISADSVGYKIASEYKAEADIAASFAAQQSSPAVRQTAIAADSAVLDDDEDDLHEDDLDDEFDEDEDELDDLDDEDIEDDADADGEQDDALLEDEDDDDEDADDEDVEVEPVDLEEEEP